MGLNLFSISGIILSLTCFGLIVFLLVFGKTKLHKIWALFNLSVGIWGVGAFFIGKASTPNEALLWLRISHIGVIFIPIFFIHVIYLFCKVSRRGLLNFAYIQGIIFTLFLPTNLFLSHTEFVFNSFYYTRSRGIIYPIFFIIWIGLVFYGAFMLIKTRRVAKGLKRSQTNYFLLSMVIGFVGGITNFLPHFGIMIYPFGNFTVPLYCIIVTYAIIKHHLMDIRVAVTRTGIFLFVYTLVLSVPFYIGYQTKSWVLAVSSKLFHPSGGTIGGTIGFVKAVFLDIQLPIC